MFAAMAGFFYGLTLNSSSTAGIGSIRKLSPALAFQLSNQARQPTETRDSAQKASLKRACDNGQHIGYSQNRLKMAG